MYTYVTLKTVYIGNSILLKNYMYLRMYLHYLLTYKYIHNLLNYIVISMTVVLHNLEEQYLN